MQNWWIQNGKMERPKEDNLLFYMVELWSIDSLHHQVLVIVMIFFLIPVGIPELIFDVHPKFDNLLDGLQCSDSPTVFYKKPSFTPLSMVYFSFHVLSIVPVVIRVSLYCSYVIISESNILDLCIWLHYTLWPLDNNRMWCIVGSCFCRIYPTSCDDNWPIASLY